MQAIKENKNTVIQQSANKTNAIQLEQTQQQETGQQHFSSQSFASGMSGSDTNNMSNFNNSLQLTQVQRRSFASAARRHVSIQPMATRYVQRKSTTLGNASAQAIHQAAARGIQGAGHQLPYYETIQKSFGKHNISHIQAYTGTNAVQASKEIGAEAYAVGHKVAFRQNHPSLHTAAHEAAHVLQQQGGVQLKDGVGEVGDVYEQHADAVADLVTQGKSAESLFNQFSPASDFSLQNTQKCVQMSADYSGDDLDTDEIDDADWKSAPAGFKPKDKIDNDGCTSQNTGISGHANQIKWGHTGSDPDAEPTDWLKFTQLIGSYRSRLAQGHLINQKIGGPGTAENLTPITKSANTVHEQQVEKPIKSWLEDDVDNNYVDYKVTPNYGEADDELKDELLDEFNNTQTIARSKKKANLKTELEEYIDAVIPSKLDIELTFARVKKNATVGENAVFKRGNTLEFEISNKEVAVCSRSTISPSGSYSKKPSKFTNTIEYGALTTNNTGTRGYAKAIIKKVGKKSSPADSPTGWKKFLILVGPWATRHFVQGHLINAGLGGSNAVKNLTPLTSSANSVHSKKVEDRIKNYLARKVAAGQIGAKFDPAVFYKVTPDYNGANASLKVKLLDEFDNTQAVIRSDTKTKLKNWLDKYIDATFAKKLDIEVIYYKKTGAASYEKTKKFKGKISNKPK